MIIGISIIFLVSLYYLFKSRKAGGYFLVISSFLLLAETIFRNYLYPAWLLKNPSENTDLVSNYALLFGLEFFLWLGMCTGFILLVFHALKSNGQVSNTS